MKSHSQRSYGSQSTVSSKRPRITQSKKRTSKRVAARVPGSSIVTIPYTARYGLNPFPSKLRCTLRYQDMMATMTVTTGIGSYQWSCNGCYDPNITQAGHQPYYFDQLMNVYDHYTVEYSKITVKFQSLADAIFNVNLLIEDDTTFSTALSHPQERSGAKNATWHNLVDDSPTITMDWTAKQAFGPSILDDKDMQGTSTSNPTEQQYYTVIAYEPLASSSTMYMNAFIEYTVVFDELSSLADS